MGNVELGDRALNTRQDLGDVFPAGLVEHQCEFFAAVTCNEIQWPARALTEGNRHGAQAFVARLMPVAVVVVLEAVDVGEQHRHPYFFTHRLLPDTLNVLVEHAPVLDAGQAVARHQFAQQTGFEKPHAADFLVHVDDRRAEYVGGDHRHRVVGKFTPRQLQRRADTEIGKHHDHIRGDRVIKNQPGEEVDENDGQHQAGKQNRHPAHVPMI